MVGPADLRDWIHVEDPETNDGHYERRTQGFELAERFCRLVENVHPHKKS